MKEHRFKMRVGLKTNNSDQSNRSSNLIETPQKLQQSNPGTSISPGLFETRQTAQGQEKTAKKSFTRKKEVSTTVWINDQRNDI